MANLLANQLGSASLINPLAEKQLAEERIKGLLLATQLLIARGILLLQRTEEPLEHKQRALLRIGLAGGRYEQRRVLRPVGAELDKRRRAEDERRGGHGRQVAIERSYRLRTVRISGVVSQKLVAVFLCSCAQSARAESGTTHLEKRGPGAFGACGHGRAFFCRTGRHDEERGGRGNAS